MAVWLVVIVWCSTLLRAWLGSRMPAPFIFTDELTPRRTRAASPPVPIQVRDEPFGLVSALYPIVLAPAYVLFDSLPDAYAAARAINAVVMSLAQSPLRDRALVPPFGGRWPPPCSPWRSTSMAYTGTLMSESAFYPAFLLAASGARARSASRRFYVS